jgi:hypothetical protein
MQKIAVFEQQQKTNKNIQFAQITTKGLKRNAWSEDLIQHAATIDDLIKLS